ncbi:HCL232Cp [Eremothecium sinecaudum]|uniref:HCL232Cp n=1 Tax=Eremothecium sinecaudum TaxID=45286 RepID=A0A0X8HR53_9SACH|nr:HCL232Cp [Eremothecium sinecaudum]AMD19919.1 HCL232Cp [Eremothecium sinecaudum]
MNGVSYKVIATEFEKPITDDRNYRYIELPNKLRAMLIQDTEIDMAAAALNVNVGSFDDPNDLYGLAHFCEHLLFMGNKKYPDENAYSSFLFQHGGICNAYTGFEQTNYFFQVEYDALYDVLDRFSGFFTSSLFSESSTDKEVNAVDSENKKNLQDDMWRLFELNKSLSNHEHPFHKFATGNLETLRDGPKSRGLNIREELLKFYEATYSANVMRLVIIGREDLDTLSKWTCELFGEVKNRERVKPEYGVPILKPEQLAKVIKVKPIKDLKKLDILFPLPDMDEYWEYQPHNYITHLVGDEGQHSLLMYLKSKGWATELSASAYTTCKGSGIFSVNVKLTDEGVEKYEDVVYTVFQYIDMLKKSLPQEWIFNELQKLRGLNFKFKQKEVAASVVHSLAAALQKDSPPEVAMNLYQFRKYDPKLIMDCLSYLNPKNSRFRLISKSVETNLTEKWYGTEYSIDDYSPEFIAKLSAPEPNPALKLPLPNEFIATNFEVEKIDTATPLEEPILLAEDCNSKLWYKKDDIFWVPKGHLYVLLKLPETNSTIVKSMLCSLYVSLVKHSLTSIIYDAESAGLGLTFNKAYDGIELKIAGYNEKFPILLNRFLTGVINFKPSEVDFEIIKEQVVQKLHNSLFDAPYLQMRELASSLVSERSWLPEQKLEVLKQLTYKQFLYFLPTLYSQLYYEMLVHGNFSRDDALVLKKEIDRLLVDGVNIADLKGSRLRSYILPEGTHWRYESPLRDADNLNSCIRKTFQFGTYSEHLFAVVSLIDQILFEPSFNFLRTKEQLGYIVGTAGNKTNGTVELVLLVQSEYPPPYVESKIDTSLKSFYQLLIDMSDDDYEKHRKALCSKLLQKYNNLKEENTNYTNSISAGDYNFRSKKRTAEIVSKLSKQEIADFFKAKVLSEESAALTVYIQSTNDNPAKKNKAEGYPTGKLITDVGNFKNELYLAPVRAPVKIFTPANN